MQCLLFVVSVHSKCYDFNSIGVESKDKAKGVFHDKEKG